MNTFDDVNQYYSMTTKAACTSFLWYLFIILIIAIDIIGSAYFETGKTYMIFSCVVCAYFYRSCQIIFNPTLLYPNLLLGAFIILVFLQKLFLQSSDTSRQIVLLFNTLILLLYAKKGQLSEVSTLGLAIKGLAIIGTISVLLITGLNNDVVYREDALIDKGMLTMWYAMLFAIATVDIINNKQILLNGILLLCVFTFNLFITQSKTAVFSACVFIAIIFFISDSKNKKTFKKWFLLILGILTVAVIMFPNELLPDSMRIAVNRVVGNDVFQVDYRSKQFDTFEMREQIDAFTLSLFLQNPIIGIGIGQYKEIAFLGVTECENTYADIFVEGGIVWGIPILGVMFAILIKAFINIKRKLHVYENQICLAIVISMLVVFRYNDFVRPFTFLYLGCCYYIVYMASAKTIKMNKTKNIESKEQQ